MFRTKFSLGVLLAIILLATQVFVAGAAPAKQDSTPITGNVDNIEFQTNQDTLETTVLVTITDDTGTQTLELSLDTAIELGLVWLDGNTPAVNEDSIGQPVEIEPDTVLNTEPVEQTIVEEQHPVGSALADFFYDLLGVDYDTVMEYHQDGYGFGVIAQALWLTNALDGDADTFALIVEAKKSKDFSGLGVTLPDGSEPQNWGQFRKAVMSDRDKAKENLGAVMSGRAEKPENGTQLEDAPNLKSNNGNGNGNSNNGKNNSDNTPVLENENNGKNINNGASNNGNNGNSANDKSEDKSNNGKDKNKNK